MKESQETKPNPPTIKSLKSDGMMSISDLAPHAEHI